VINSGKYCLYNEQIIEVSTSSNSLTPDLISWMSKSFLIKWRSSGSRIPFFKKQYKRLLDILSLVNPDYIPAIEEQNFEKLLVRLIQKNRFFKGVELKIFLKPESQDVTKIDILVFCLEHPDEEFVMNNRGLIIALAPEPQHPGKLEILRIQQQGFTELKWDFLVLEQEVDYFYFSNASKHLLECTHSRIYLIKGNKIFTPDYPELTPWGIEASIADASSRIGLKLLMSDSIRVEHLNQADEVFVANDFFGINWVMGHEDKRYFRKYSPLIVKELNREWKETN
jgi:hypothetical protein